MKQQRKARLNDSEEVGRRVGKGCEDSTRTRKMQEESQIVLDGVKGRKERRSYGC